LAFSDFSDFWRLGRVLTGAALITGRSRNLDLQRNFLIKVFTG